MTDTRERQRRIATAWAQNPDSDVDAIAANVDAAMADEAEARAEGDAQTAAMVQSMTNMMFRCNVCGGTKSHYARDGLCDQCRFVVAQVLAERNGAEVVRDGHTRREYVVAYLERTAERNR